MPSNLYTFADSEIRLRWREPQFTAGVNLARSLVSPAGIYRGFRLAGTAVNHELTIVADAAGSDHVAIYRTSTDYAIRLRRVNDYTMDLSAYAGQSGIVIALYALYAIGLNTVAYVRAYTAAEYAAAVERPDLVVLGVVDVPPAAPITAIYYDGRVVPSLKLLAGAVAPKGLIRNSSFELGSVGATQGLLAYFWEKAISAGTGSWRVSTTAAASGAKSMALNFAAGPLSGTLVQPLNCPVKSGQLLRLRLRLRVDIAATGGTLAVGYNFFDSAGVLGSAVSVSLSVGAATAGVFTTVERTLPVPAGVTHLRDLTFTATNLTFGALGDTLFLDDVQVHVLEADPTQEDPTAESMAAFQMAAALFLQDSQAASAYGFGALLRYVSALTGGFAGIKLTDGAGSASSVEVTGTIIQGTGLDALPDQPRTIATRSAGVPRTLIARLPGTGGNATIRLYRSVSGSDEFFEITVNAAWTDAVALWARDTAAIASVKYVFGPSGIDVYSVAAASWGDGAWTTTALRFSTTPNPAPTAAPNVNALHASQIPKAWGLLTFDGVGNVVITDGFNIQSATLVAGSVVVAFATPMASGNYHVSCSRPMSAFNAWRTAEPYGLGAGSFGLSAFYHTGGGNLILEDLFVTACTVTFAVFGEQ